MSETGARKWIITITVILASMLELIDTSIVNVALPQIMGNLGATLDEATWIITAYVVANVIVIPMTGWFASVFGRSWEDLGMELLYDVAHNIAKLEEHFQRILEHSFFQPGKMHVDDARHRFLVGKADVVEEAATQERIG